MEGQAPVLAEVVGFSSDCAYLMPTIGLGLLLLPGASVTMLTIAVILVGATLGAEYDVIIYMLTKHFGLRHFGKIFGSVLSAGAVASATSPVLTGWVRDTTGNYDLALVALAVMMASCAVGMFATGRSRPMVASPVH